MAAAYSLTCCSSTLVPENKFSHNLKAHHSFKQKLSHHGGKNMKKRELSKAPFSHINHLSS